MRQLFEWVKATPDNLPKESVNARYNKNPGMLLPTSDGFLYHGINFSRLYTKSDVRLRDIEWAKPVEMVEDIELLKTENAALKGKISQFEIMTNHYNLTNPTRE
jgi:hypothetical protein